MSILFKVREHRLRHKPISAIGGVRIYRIGRHALANKRYRWGIQHLEKYQRQFQLRQSDKYVLGLLYDHEAKRHKEHMHTLLSKADKIYHDIARDDPKYFLANFGIGRVHWIRGDYRAALRWQQRAYRQMLARTPRARGALGIGQLYEERKDYTNAEKWYRKEFRALSGDFGTTINLMRFYTRRGAFRNACAYALRARRKMGSEFSRAVYRGLGIQKSKYLNEIRHEVEATIASEKCRPRGNYLSSSK